MTDHRATDLSYGHLGEATYDIETGEWRFSRDPFSQNIQQLLPLRSSIRPSIETFPSMVSALKNRIQSLKLLGKSRPETISASPVLSSLALSQAPAHSRIHVGQLLAIGMAVDVKQTFGSRKTTIIGTSYGEAGHVLRLIKPRIQRNDWGTQSSARLSLLDTGCSDHAYWVGIGGRILQITFAEEGNLPSTWLAVRQANATTIFRPSYGASTTPALVPSGFSNPYPSSRLNANPVAVLTAGQSGSRNHVDMTFNPWYTRQFAVVDELGTWTTWDIEGGRNKCSDTRLIPGKSANIYDGYVPDPTLKPPDNADGWHQVLWVGNVSTIVVCNRRHVAVFNTKAAPTRLPCRDFFSPSNSDWVHDMKRSPSNLSQFFILTSSRLFWLEVILAREEKHDGTGLRVILSYRHFRDANDRSMRISVLNDDAKNHIRKPEKYYSLHPVSVSISSEKSNLVNIYTFSENPDGVDDPTSFQGFLNIPRDIDDQGVETPYQLQTVHFLGISLNPIPNRSPGPELQYIEDGIKFYQVLALTSDLGLSSGLWSVRSISLQDYRSGSIQVTAPTRTCIHTPGFMSSKRAVDDPWLVPDRQIDSGETRRANRSSHHINFSRGEAKDDSRLRINFRTIFQQAFKDSGNLNSGVAELLENAMDRIRLGKASDQLSMKTFLELAQIPGYTEDLEQGGPILRDFLQSLKLNEESDAPSALIISNLTLCPGIGFQTLQDSQLPDLLKIYDQVAENWIATLPLRVSSLTRLAKFKIARKVAVELYLSSIGISLQNKLAQLPLLPSTEDAEELPAPIGKSAATLRAGSPALFSSQIPSNSLNEPGIGLPTPAQTPSLYSQSHASASEYAEDDAISRLRQYASIKSKPDLGTSKILSQWPSTPGVDPATYSWEEIQKKAAADESEEETDHKKRREAARRKRRTERFLSRESTAATEAYSQPACTPFGSQPGAGQYPASSQTVAYDVPMTQPINGAFGRSAQQGKKKRKKRAAGFR